MAARKKGRAAALVLLARALRASGRPGAPGIGAHLAAVPRMLRLAVTGRYPGLAKGRMVLALVGLIYLVSPFDLMQTALLGLIGLGDDALVAAWVAGAVLGETDAFLRWEAGRTQRLVVGEVVR